VELCGKESENDYRYSSGNHGSGTAPCRLHDDVNESPGKGGTGIEMFYEDVRTVAGHNIAEYAAADTCYHTHEKHKENAVVSAYGVCCLDTHNCEDSKAQ